MSRVKFEFCLERGVIDSDEIEDSEVAKKISDVTRLVQAGSFSAAVLALPPVRFEWSWSAASGDPEEVFVNPRDLDILLSSSNSTIRLGMHEEYLIISVNVIFELKAKKGLNKDIIQNWLDENSMDNAGYVSGGWSYKSDDGVSVSVI